MPRIIGALALAGLAANGLFGGAGGAAGGGGAPPSQGRAEAAAALLALACVALPAVGGFIADAEPGRGRGAAAALPGSVQAFRVAASGGGGAGRGGGGGGEGPRPPPASPPPSLPSDGGGDAAAAELAWSSYALLRNANCCTVVVLAVGYAEVHPRRKRLEVGAKCQVGRAGGVGTVAFSVAFILTLRHIRA